MKAVKSWERMCAYILLILCFINFWVCLCNVSTIVFEHNSERHNSRTRNFGPVHSDRAVSITFVLLFGTFDCFNNLQITALFYKHRIPARRGVAVVGTHARRQIATEATVTVRSDPILPEGRSVSSGQCCCSHATLTRYAFLVTARPCPRPTAGRYASMQNHEAECRHGRVHHKII